MTMLSFNQVVSLIKAVGNKRTILIQGENGIGKTAVFHHLKRDPLFADHIHVDPIDCTQLSDGSVWMPDIDRDNGVSRELPNERFGVSRSNQKGVNGAKPALIFLDEIAKARQFIKDVLAPIVYDRRVGNYHMPEGSVVFGATNLDVEGLGDSMQAHLRNRLTVVTMRKPTKDEWVHYESANPNAAPEVLAFAEEYPVLFESFLDYEQGGVHAGKTLHRDNPYIFNPRASQSAYVTPRSLSAASMLVNQQTLLDTDTLQHALAGTIGEAGAEALSAYIRFGTENPSFDEVINNPTGARIAKSPVAQIVMAFKLVTSTTTREHAEAVTQYAARLDEVQQSLFCNRVAANSQKAVLFMTTPAFKDMLVRFRMYFPTN